MEKRVIPIVVPAEEYMDDKQALINEISMEASKVIGEIFYQKEISIPIKGEHSRVPICILTGNTQEMAHALGQRIAANLLEGRQINNRVEIKAERHDD